MKPLEVEHRSNESRLLQAGAGRCGFTLIEMMISMGLLSLVMIAATAVVSFALRAAPVSDDPTSIALASRTAVDQILSDLTDATSVSINETGGIVRLAITTHDLDNDSVPDLIEYLWSGNSRDPVYRGYNGLQTTLCPHADTFTIAATGNIRGVSNGTSSATVAAQSIAAVPRYDATINAIRIETNWIAQRFSPRLSTNATSWNMTSVALWLQRDGIADSTGMIELRADAAGRPGSVLAFVPFAELALIATPRLQTFILWRSNLDPRASYWIVLRTLTLFTPGRVLQTPYSVADDTGQYAISSNGSTWTIDPDASLFFQITGNVSTTIARTTPETVATSISITLKSSDPGLKATHGAVHLPARPLLDVTGDADIVVTDGQGLLGAVGGTFSGTGSQVSGLINALLGGGT